jgi:hypothetical protein
VADNQTRLDLPGDLRNGANLHEGKVNYPALNGREPSSHNVGWMFKNGNGSSDIFIWRN